MNHNYPTPSIHSIIANTPSHLHFPHSPSRLHLSRQQSTPDSQRLQGENPGSQQKSLAQNRHLHEARRLENYKDQLFFKNELKFCQKIDEISYESDYEPNQYDRDLHTKYIEQELVNSTANELVQKCNPDYQPPHVYAHQISPSTAYTIYSPSATSPRLQLLYPTSCCFQQSEKNDIFQAYQGIFVERSGVVPLSFSGSRLMRDKGDIPGMHDEVEIVQGSNKLTIAKGLVTELKGVQSARLPQEEQFSRIQQTTFLLSHSPQQQQIKYTNGLNDEFSNKKKLQQCNRISTQQTSRNQQPSFLENISSIENSNQLQTKKQIYYQINNLNKLTAKLQHHLSSNESAPLPRNNPPFQHQTYHELAGIHIRYKSLKHSSPPKKVRSNPVLFSYELIDKVERLKNCMNFGKTPMNEKQIRRDVMRMLNILKVEKDEVKLNILQFQDYLQAEILKLGLIFIWQRDKKAYFGHYCDYKYRNLKQKDGFGYQIKCDKYMYIGYFKKNRKEGEGLMIADNGNEYEGVWMANAFQKHTKVDRKLKDHIMAFQQPQSSPPSKPFLPLSKKGGWRVQKNEVIVREKSSKAQRIRLKSKQQIEQIFIQRKSNNKHNKYMRSADKGYQMKNHFDS